MNELNKASSEVVAYLKKERLPSVSLHKVHFDN